MSNQTILIIEDERSLVDVLTYNLKSEGFKFYAAIGVFSESMTVSGVRGDLDFNGGQFGVGLGYNWPSVSLDYSINVRSADDYADFGRHPLRGECRFVLAGPCRALLNGGQAPGSVRVPAPGEARVSRPRLPQ